MAIDEKKIRMKYITDGFRADLKNVNFMSEMVCHLAAANDELVKGSENLKRIADIMAVLSTYYENSAEYFFSDRNVD